MISIEGLLKYKISGNAYNPTLKEGDEIFLNEFDKYINIYGGIANPGKYEYVEGETLHDFILIAGNFTYNANHNNIEISRFDESNIEYKISVNEKEFDSIKLMPYDHINILTNENSTVPEVARYYKSNNVNWIIIGDENYG